MRLSSAAARGRDVLRAAFTAVTGGEVMTAIDGI
jgi:hypothetical protein